MSTTTIFANTHPATTGILTHGVLNASTPNTFKAVMPVYYIEQALISGQTIAIDYTLNDEWANAQISLSALVSFVNSTGLNEWCNDFTGWAGDHTQEVGTFDMDTFLAENLNYAVRAYLANYRIGQLNVN